jgi:hypothetical protein
VAEVADVDAGDEARSRLFDCESPPDRTSTAGPDRGTTGARRLAPRGAPRGGHLPSLAASSRQTLVSGISAQERTEV